MMRAMGLILTLGMLWALGRGADAATLGPAAEELRKIDVGSIDRPASDAVILYRGVHVRLDADGRVTRRVRLVQRLLTDHAIAIGGDPRVAYDTTRQELSIDVCRAFMLDGREVKAAPHAFNRVTPERVASCPDRVGLQEMVVSYVGVERGCMTELDYTLTDRVPWRPWLEGIEELGGPYPVLAGDLWIETPPGAGVQAQSLTAGARSLPAAEPFCVPMAKPWSYGPVPAFPDEGGSPAAERVPSIVYSTGTWERLGAFVLERLTGASSADSAVTAWAGGDLAGGRPPLNDAERLERVAHLVGERTMDADDAPLRWILPVRPAARTFATSCGNLLDRAALGLAALRAYGIDAKVVLHPIGPTVAAPALSCFDDIRLETASGELSVREGRAGAWIDPAPASKELVILDGSHAELRPVEVRSGAIVPPGREVASRLSLRLAVAEDGSVRGEASIDAHGAFVAGLGTENLKGYLESLVAGYAKGAELAGYRVAESGPMALSVVFSFTGKGIGSGLSDGKRLYRIPSAPGLPDAAFAGDVSYVRDGRRTPLSLGRPIREEVTVRLELPPEMRVVVSPQGGEWTGPNARLSTSWTRDGRAWRYHRRFDVAEGTVIAADYPAHRTVMVRRLEDAADRIVLAAGTAK